MWAPQESLSVWFALYPRLPGILQALNKCRIQTRAVDRNFSTLCVLWFYVPNFHCDFLFLITDWWLIMLCTWVLLNICFLIVRRRLKHFFAYLLGSGSGFTFSVYPGEEVTSKCWATEVRSLQFQFQLGTYWLTTLSRQSTWPLWVCFLICKMGLNLVLRAFQGCEFLTRWVKALQKIRDFLRTESASH